MADLLYRASLALIPRLYVALSFFWFSTCRVRVYNRQAMRQVLENGGGVAVFWHYSFLYIFHHMRGYPGVAMVSASRDGEYIARVAGLLGLATVRGSSNRQGVRALKELIRYMRQGKNAAIVGDGSQGPSRKLQPGCLLLAARSGRPILPMVWSADRYWTVSSWDRTVLPKPFSRIYMLYGEPVHVAARLSADELEQVRMALEEQLNTLYRQAWRMAGHDAHDGVLTRRKTDGG